MTVCRYFLQGNCRFGDRCRFEHTDPYESNSNTYDSSNRHDYSYQNRGRQQPAHSNYYQGRDGQYNERYSQNQQYSSQKNYQDPRYDSNESVNTSERDYYANKYNRNKHAWMSDDYKKQMEHKPQQSGNERFFNTSTPKSKTAFSFKDTEVESRRDRPNDLRMNDRNLMDADTIKQDILSWEFGNQWPFTCYCPTPGKSSFPGFVDLSQEELRLEAYKAKENNTYDSYVDSVTKALQDIKLKQAQMKEPSVQLMSIIERIRRGEDFGSESVVDGTVPSFARLEDMVAEENSAQQSTPASSFSFRTAPTSVFGSNTNSASSFSFKTTLETDGGIKSAASSFSFKLPSEDSSKASGQDPANHGIYTPMDKLSEQDKEQFSAPTFTLGKIPTVPPPQQMCF